MMPPHENRNAFWMNLAEVLLLAILGTVPILMSSLMDRGFEKRRSGKTGSVEYYGLRPRRSGVEGLADVQQPGGDALKVLSLNTAR